MCKSAVNSYRRSSLTAERRGRILSGWNTPLWSIERSSAVGGRYPLWSIERSSAVGGRYPPRSTSINKELVRSHLPSHREYSLNLYNRPIYQRVLP